MKDIEQRVLEIPISELVSNPAQPAARTTARKVQAMVEALDRDGQITPVHIQSLNGQATSTKKWMLVTGHTRVAGLSFLGQKTVKAIVVPPSQTPALAWARESAVTRKVTGGQWFTAWAQLPKNQRDAFLEAMIPHVASSIRKMVQIFGEVRALELASKDHPVQPGAARIIASTHEKLKQFVPRFRLTPRDVGEWVVSHRGAQADLSHAFPRVAQERTRTWTKLAKAIKAGVAHPRGAW